MFKIKCLTLFDITKTDISNRRRHLSEEHDSNLELLRNQQSNFETVLQIISLRNQPENITAPIKRIETSKKSWGKIYHKCDRLYYWSFSFTVNSIGVFVGESEQFEKLYHDCENVPMITGLQESYLPTSQIKIDSDYRNIIFEMLDD